MNLEQNEYWEIKSRVRYNDEFHTVERQTFNQARDTEAGKYAAGIMRKIDRAQKIGKEACEALQFKFRREDQAPKKINGKKIPPARLSRPVTQFPYSIRIGDDFQINYGPKADKALISKAILTLQSL